MGENFKEIPEFGISLKIENEPVPEGEALVSLVISVRECILQLDEEGVKAFERKKNDSFVSFKDTISLFRRKERLSNTKLILQYLLMFLENMPSPERVRVLPENPFLQFWDFVLYQISDLKEDDVIEAVLREYRELGILKEDKLWLQKGKIRVFHDKLKESMRNAKGPTPDGYKSVFSALKEISLFWFGIRRENLDRIRKSDLFSYKLVRILLSKLDNPENIDQPATPKIDII